MRYVKMLGLLAVAAAALMAFAGVASATTVTSPAGTVYTSTIKAASEGTTTLHNSSLGIAVSCEVSEVEGKVESHGAGVTTIGKLTKLTFGSKTKVGECGTSDVTVLNAGSLEIHTEKENEVPAGVNGNGTLTSTGAEITINSTAIGVSCTYKTTGTDVGVLTGSKNVVKAIDEVGGVKTTTFGGTATLDINSATIPRTSDSVFCGSSGKWTGSYIVNTPDYLDVD